MSDPGDTFDEMVALQTYHNEFAAGVVCAKLEDAGIPAKALSSSHALLGAFGQTGWLPFTVWVPKVEEDRARQILETVRLEKGTVDWDAVDVGEPDPTDPIALRVARADGDAETRRSRMTKAISLFGAGVLLGAVGMYLPIGAMAIPVSSIGFLLFICACGMAFGEMMKKSRRA